MSATTDSAPGSAGSPGGRVAIIGAGSIGAAFAVVFARAGLAVALQDPSSERRGAVPGEIAARLRDLRSFGLLDEEPDAVSARVAVVADPEEAVAGAIHVQECAPENLELKRELMARLDRAAPAGVPIASSSSAIRASLSADGLPGRSRCLVAHPGNPPFLIPVIEIVPAPFTAPEVAERTERFFAAAGMSPVRLGAEVEGFVFNRLQGALLREAYCLVRDGVCTVADVDRIMRDGLGFRWSVIGPFETIDLNSRGGIPAHARTMGPAYARMGAERGQNDPWTPELVGRVAAERRALLPLEQWEERVRWRDRALMALLRFRRSRSG